MIKDGLGQRPDSDQVVALENRIRGVQDPSLGDSLGKDGVYWWKVEARGWSERVERDLVKDDLSKRVEQRGDISGCLPKLGAVGMCLRLGSEENPHL